MAKPYFIDIHCHLEMCKNAPEIIKRAEKARVISIAHGVFLESNKKVLEFSKQSRFVKAALGLYPIDALNLNEDEIQKNLDFIEQHKDEMVAIGEVGMDFKEDSEQHGRQREVFSRIIELAFRLDKPLVVHSRKAEKECIELLEHMRAKKVLMHCFSGRFSLIERIVKNGWYLSIPTSVKNSEHFQKMIEKVPIEQLLCETDAPFLHPDKLSQNEPVNVVESYKKIAEIKQILLEQVKEQIYSNALRLLGEKLNEVSN
jgi:TatD DNase family protein